MKPATTLILLGAAGVVGFLIYRRFTTGAATTPTPPSNRKPFAPILASQLWSGAKNLTNEVSVAYAAGPRAP